MEYQSSKKVWAKLLRAKFLRVDGNIINYQLIFSVFQDIKWVYSLVEAKTRCINGDGRSTLLFFDFWCDNASIANTISARHADMNLYRAKVSGLIVGNNWVIAHNIRGTMIRDGIDPDTLPEIVRNADFTVWMLDLTG